MDGDKPLSISMVAGQELSQNDNPFFYDMTKYISLIFSIGNRFLFCA